MYNNSLVGYGSKYTTMQNLKLKLTLKGVGRYKGRLSVLCSRAGSTTRHYMQVAGLQCTDYAKWSEESQCFVGIDNTVLHDNGVLNDVISGLSALIESYHFTNGKDLFEAYRGTPNIRAKKEPTLGEFLELIVEEEKRREIGTSSNYQLYNTLLNKLRGVNIREGRTFTPAFYKGVRLHDTPLSEISDYHFRAFGEWIKTEFSGAGYRNLMTTFAATIEKATERYQNVPHMNYKWRKEMNRKTTRREQLTARQVISTAKDDIPALTSEEFDRFLNFDLSTILPPQKERKRLVQLYYDTALLLYYTASRPADVIQWDWVHNYCEQTHQITYIPHKLRNRGGRRVIVNLCPQAISIIEKYRGRSKGGYLLPLPMNEIAWGELEGETFKKWEIHRSHTIQSINLWLQRIAKALNFEIKRLTLYVFRHSSITHCINRYNMNAMKVAAMAGTSVAIINKHYYNPNIDNETVPFID